MKIAIAIFLTIACLYSIVEILGMVKSLRIAGRDSTLILVSPQIIMIISIWMQII